MTGLHHHRRNRRHGRTGGGRRPRRSEPQPFSARRLRLPVLHDLADSWTSPRGLHRSGHPLRGDRLQPVAPVGARDHRLAWHAASLARVGQALGPLPHPPRLIRGRRRWVAPGPTSLRRGFAQRARPKSVRPGVRRLSESASTAWRSQVGRGPSTGRVLCASQHVELGECACPLRGSFTASAAGVPLPGDDGEALVARVARARHAAPAGLEAEGARAGPGAQPP